MCGIVGAIGHIETKKYIVEGLKILDYRGYDSAGIALLNGSKIDIYKYAGTVENLEDKIKDIKSTDLAIGHTRWATHGGVSDKNSHPHLSFHEKIALVHNGVIENYLELKNKLIEKGYKFRNDTDSEVVSNLVEYYYEKTGNMIAALQKAKQHLDGSYALGIISIDDPDKLYIMKNYSPLLIGVAENACAIASDASAIISLTNKFIDLDDGEYGFITSKGATIYSKDDEIIEKEFITKSPDTCVKDLAGYPHFMLKEIEEIENVVRRLTVTYFEKEKYKFDSRLLKAIKESDHLLFLGCGTSYHASIVGGRLFENIGIPCSNHIASEWAYAPRIYGKKPFVILISQSGETADLIHCMKTVKHHGLKSLIITNTKGSTLDRLCNFSIFLNAGLEVSVASTKAYVAQVTSLVLLSSAVSGNNKTLDEIYECCEIINQIKKQHKDKIKEIAEEISKSKNLFYLGRGSDYDLSMEASLKLKEISYIHSEALPGGELKHGPIALIEQDLPVIAFVTNPKTSKMMRGNIQEVKSRGAKTFIISTRTLAHKDDAIVVGDFPPALTSIAISSITFYLAYYTALAKGCNVDKPRNLAKSVTVE